VRDGVSILARATIYPASSEHIQRVNASKLLAVALWTWLTSAVDVLAAPFVCRWRTMARDTAKHTCVVHRKDELLTHATY
jgi:hypothetical protein